MLHGRHVHYALGIADFIIHNALPTLLFTASENFKDNDEFLSYLNGNGISQDDCKKLRGNVDKKKLMPVTVITFMLQYHVVIDTYM